MNLSGLIVVAAEGHVDDVSTQLRALDGIEVRIVDAASRSIVIVQEAASVGAEVAGFSRILALPHVISVRLGAHYFGDDAAIDRQRDAIAIPPA